MPPPPVSLTTINCKYLNVKGYNLPPNSLKALCYFKFFYQVCAATVKAKHSRIWAQAMPFCPSNKLTFDLLTFTHVSDTILKSQGAGAYCGSLPHILFNQYSPSPNYIELGHGQPKLRLLLVVCTVTEFLRF